MSGNTKEETEQQFVSEAPVEEENGKKRTVFRGELALFITVMINSFGVVLMLYSGAGISAISSVPFAFSEVAPVISLGTWTYIFQAALILSLMIMRKKFVPAYLFSFVVGFAFSELLDLHEAWIDILPKSLGFCRIVFCYQVICCCALALRFLTAVDCRSFRRTCFRENYHRLQACVIPESKSVMM